MPTLIRVRVWCTEIYVSLSLHEGACLEKWVKNPQTVKNPCKHWYKTCRFLILKIRTKSAAPVNTGVFEFQKSAEKSAKIRTKLLSAKNDALCLRVNP